MIEVTGNLWTYPTDWRIITTNGFVRKDNCCVMGRGCAYEAAQKFPMLPLELGKLIQKKGNHVFQFPQYKLLSFPVKHRWDQDADLNLIMQSVKELKGMLQPTTRYLLVRPGVGNGRLRWEHVKPIVSALPDSVKVITFD